MAHAVPLNGEPVLASALLFLLILQPVFVALKGSAPAIAALHAVNGLAILAIAVFIEWRLRHPRP